MGLSLLMDIQDAQHTNKPSSILSVLVFAEFSDRFCFCGALTILILYLKNIFLFSDIDAYATWGVFLSLSYITPVIGGYLADKILGFKKAIFWGMLALIGGNLLLCLQTKTSLYTGLSLLLCGIGLFKGNVSSLIGILCNQEYLKKQAAYSRFFMGITLGAILGPLIYGFLMGYLSWAACFFLGAIGNIISFLFLLYHRNKIDLKNTSAILNSNSIPTLMKNKFYLLGFTIVVMSMSLLFIIPRFSNGFLGFASLATVFILTIVCIQSFPEQRKNIIGLTLISILLVGYYAASFQVSGSLVLAISNHLTPTLFGWQITPTVFTSLEALFAFLFIPLLTRIWSYLDKKGITPSFIFKFICGLIAAGISFLIFAYAFHDKNQAVLLLTLANLFLGLSVACIFPTHMAIVSDYAPLKAQGTLMGMSFLSDALAGYVGSLAYFNGNLTYHTMYMFIAYMLFGMGIILFLLIPLWGFLFGRDSRLVGLSV